MDGERVWGAVGECGGADLREDYVKAVKGVEEALGILKIKQVRSGGAGETPVLRIDRTGARRTQRTYGGR